MAEIKIERKRHHLLPWILALVLLALVFLGLVAAANRTMADAPDHGAATTLRDDTPPRLRQYASLTPLSQGACPPAALTFPAPPLPEGEEGERPRNYGLKGVKGFLFLALFPSLPRGERG